MSEERRKKIDMIRALPGEVEEIVKGLNDKQLDTPYREGGWTVRQVVHHLADAHMNAFVRMKLILTENKPALKPYDQDAWAAMPDTTEMPIGVSRPVGAAPGARPRRGLVADRDLRGAGGTHARPPS